MTNTRRRRHWPWIVVLAMLLNMIPVKANVAYAAGGAYSLNFCAADPADSPTYEKFTPYTKAAIRGDRASNPIPYADAYYAGTSDFVESLTPDNLALGQIVPFL